MRSSIGKRIEIAAWSALLILLLTTHAVSAQGPDSETNLELRLPNIDMTTGDRVEALVHLTDGKSEPVSGAEINVTQTVEFMGGAADVDLGRVVTNEQGQGVVVLGLTSDGELFINADFAGDDLRSPSSATEIIQVREGPPLFHQEGGIKVPGVNVYLLVAILGAVWATYLVVMGILLMIARMGSLRPHPETEAQP